MVALSNAVPDPRTMMVVILSTSYPNAAIAVLAMPSIFRFHDPTEAANVLRLICFIQFHEIIRSLYISRVFAAYY